MRLLRPGPASEPALYVREAIPRMMGLAVALTGQRADAEDLLQETLATVVLKWARVSRAGDVDAYVRRIMLNTVISRSRPRWRTEVVTDEFDVDEPSRTDHHPERLADRDEVLRLLATLPARQRAVLALRYYEDLPDAEIATALGCSPQAVRNAAHAGHKTLRARLGDAVDPAKEDA